MRRHIFAILLFASSASAADLPRYWSVHIDIASDRAAYEELDRRFFAIQREMNLPTPVLFSTPDGSFFSLRPRGTMTDFDKPVDTPEFRKRTASISDETHKTLRTHHNEIWRIDRGLTTEWSTAAPKYALLRTDVVKPVDDEAYGEEMKALGDDLAARGVRVVAFFSVYGDGAYRYLFMSDRPLSVRKLRTAKTRDTAATPRTDLTGTDPASWLSF